MPKHYITLNDKVFTIHFKEPITIKSEDITHINYQIKKPLIKVLFSKSQNGTLIIDYKQDGISKTLKLNDVEDVEKVYNRINSLTECNYEYI